MRPIRTIESDATNTAELISGISKLDDGLAWVAEVIFGKAVIYGFRKPSDIPTFIVGANSGRPLDGYWRRGVRADYPKSLKVKYQNEGLTRD